MFLWKALNDIASKECMSLGAWAAIEITEAKSLSILDWKLDSLAIEANPCGLNLNKGRFDESISLGFPLNVKSIILATLGF